jgi:hypothetical protein
MKMASHTLLITQATTQLKDVSTTNNKKEKDQDNTKTTTGGLASWTLGILFLFLVAIPMQSIKAITTATTTSWAYLINKMIGKMHTSNGSPEGAKTEKPENG